MNKKRKILISVILMVVLLTIVFSFWQKPVLAETPTASNTQGESKLLSTLAKAVGWIVFFVLSAVGKLTVLLVDLLANVAQFNHFIDAPAVVKGWVIMRDICNMFFIVVLLIISFGTVLGIEGWNYKRLLGRLILAAVLINLSKTFSGLLIDAGQVVMMTFVNAFKDMAAGNIVNAIGLNNILNFSDSLGENDFASAMNVTIAVILAVIFTFVSFVTILSLFLILLIRIVMLWFLVIFSPVVYVGGLVPAIGKLTSPWWEQFTKWIMIGPILAFFLWLSLSMASPSQTPTGYYYNKSIEGTNQVDSKSAGYVGALLAITEPARALDYSFAIGMLIMSLTFAVQLGGRYAGAMVNFSKKAGWGLAGVASGAFVTKIPWVKSQIQARKEKISTTPYARILTAEGRAASQKEMDERARIGRGIPGAYERAVTRRIKDYDERGLFRNEEDMLTRFNEAKNKRNFMEAEVYGRQLAKNKKLGSDHLSDFMEGVAGKEYQRAAGVLDKLSDEANDYNASIIPPVKFENGKYRNKSEEEEKKDFVKLREKARKTKVGDMEKTLRQMNDADKYKAQAHFYIGLGDDQIINDYMEEATKDKIFKELEKVSNSTSYTEELRQEALGKINHLRQRIQEKEEEKKGKKKKEGESGSGKTGAASTGYSYNINDMGESSSTSGASSRGSSFGGGTGGGQAESRAASEEGGQNVNTQASSILGRKEKKDLEFLKQKISDKRIWNDIRFKSELESARKTASRNDISPLNKEFWNERLKILEEERKNNRPNIT